MAQTAPATAFVLHRLKIGKGAVKKLGIYSQWSSEFWTVIFHLPLGRGSMNDFAKNLRASPLNEGLTINTTFSWIHLDGQ
jgi:hypothetical protein